MFKRLTFFILLLLNVALFAWGYQRKLPEQALPILPKLEGPSILLLSEAPPDVFAPIVKNRVRHCLRVGPIDKQLVTEEILATLSEAGHDTTLETETVIQNSGFWLAMATTDEQVEALMAELNSAGILDVWRFDKGPLTGMLSLGIYSDYAKAKKRLSALKKKGFITEIRPREIETPNYWIRTRYVTTDQDANQEAQTAIDQVYERYPSLTFPPPGCGS